MSMQVSGTEGYAEGAEQLIESWKQISFVEHHGPILHLIPNAPANILDIGAGIGADAAAFAAMGHCVVAVEPTDELRIPGMALHPSARIEWLDDSLPDLAVLRARGQTFDVVMLTAVWMHLDERPRRYAMPIVVSLMREGGVMIMSLRQGPVPQGRRMFDVSAEETVELAQAHGLHLLLNMRTESIQPLNRSTGVTWTRLAFAHAK